jgi:hypothetical protein
LFHVQTNSSLTKAFMKYIRGNQLAAKMHPGKMFLHAASGRDLQNKPGYINIAHIYMLFIHYVYTKICAYYRAIRFSWYELVRDQVNDSQEKKFNQMYNIYVQYILYIAIFTVYTIVCGLLIIPSVKSNYRTVYNSWKKPVHDKGRVSQELEKLVQQTHI